MTLHPTATAVLGVAGRLVAEGVGLLAAALARADGATCRTVEVPGVPGAGAGELVRVRVCSGARGRTFARGGTTYGTTYVTGADARTCAGDRLRHEAVHVLQWRRWGLLLPLLYGLAELRAGGDPTRNRFEAAAGLRDGGYA
ncbi:Fe-S oxidoreductase [Streptomyces sp. NP160]|uniref:Fe-S oxidoreductase n=1 Tax=Streptomyces sp. NP160 TaxID=2586637 RepID=UPI0011192C41|nr:Fe-S oxidoreductase [Streptomyces sp. NP160]TNM68733.1 Fe-S oxidoreductase [Streptomyces sp. NP160]